MDTNARFTIAWPGGKAYACDQHAVAIWRWAQDVIAVQELGGKARASTGVPAGAACAQCLPEPRDFAWARLDTR